MQGAVAVPGCCCYPLRSLGRLVALSLCVLVGSEVARILGLVDPRARTVESSTLKVNEGRDGSTAAERSDALFRDNLALVQPRPVNVSVVLLGDSVTRYQYLSLAYFLKYGHWFDPHAHPSIVYSHTFHHPRLEELDWGEYFFQTNRMLYPHEICDCQRYSNFQLERRYFYDPIRNNTVVYINLNGDQPTDSKLPGYYFGGLDPEPIFRNFTQVLEDVAPPRRAFRQKRMVAWQFKSWSDVLRLHVKRLHMPGIPTAFLNAGLHPHKLQPSDFVNVTNDHRIRVVWKTTTFTKRLVVDTLDTTDAERDSRKTIDDTDQLFCREMECLDVSWTRNVARRHFYDALHYREPVYRILNEQLLDFVEALPRGYTRLDRRRVASHKKNASIVGVDRS